MSRITDTERGARIAQDAASRVLNAGKGRQGELFKPRRLSTEQRAMWRGIAAAAADALAEEAFLRSIQGGARG